MVLQSDFVFIVLVMACYTVNYMLGILLPTSSICNTSHDMFLKKTENFVFSDKRILYNQKLFVILPTIVYCTL